MFLTSKNFLNREFLYLLKAQFKTFLKIQLLKSRLSSNTEYPFLWRQGLFYSCTYPFSFIMFPFWSLKVF